MAELFQTTKQSISLHVRNILDEGELEEEATVKENLTVQTEGKRKVSRQILLYNLQLILAVGFRVRSLRGMQFRRWESRSEERREGQEGVSQGRSRCSPVH